MKNNIKMSYTLFIFSFLIFLPAAFSQCSISDDDDLGIPNYVLDRAEGIWVLDFNISSKMSPVWGGGKDYDFFELRWELIYSF